MKEEDIKKKGEEYLMEIITTKDTTLLRNACLEMIVLTGHLYRRIHIHTFLHPFFFLAGFLTCYYFMK